MIIFALKVYLYSPEDFFCFEDLYLDNWFPKSEVTCKRSCLAKLIRKIAEDQATPDQAVIFPELNAEEEEYVANEEFADSAEKDELAESLSLTI